MRISLNMYSAHVLRESAKNGRIIMSIRSYRIHLISYDFGSVLKVLKSQTEKCTMDLCGGTIFIIIENHFSNPESDSFDID